MVMNLKVMVCIRLQSHAQFVWEQGRMDSSSKHKCQHCKKKVKETQLFEELNVCWDCFKNLCEQFSGTWGE
jgi:hypothetical protein